LDFFVVSLNCHEKVISSAVAYPRCAQEPKKADKLGVICQASADCGTRYRSFFVKHRPKGFLYVDIMDVAPACIEHGPVGGG
jgi:hypothetical protein